MKASFLNGRQNQLTELKPKFDEKVITINDDVIPAVNQAKISSINQSMIKSSAVMSNKDQKSIKMGVRYKHQPCSEVA